MTNPITKKLEEARLKLFDLTMRNRLLNFRPPKRKAIMVVDEDPTEIYEMLVLQEKSMEFLPKIEESAEVDDVRANGDSPTSRTIVPDCHVPVHNVGRERKFSFRKFCKFNFQKSVLLSKRG